ncbi:MAG: hypothetical protein ISS70_09725 [Phycisphaerae bacterium]|nr:hypothetical protein [Phycisphaerae bacterium]
MKQEIRNILAMGWYLDTSLFMDFIDRNIRTGFSSPEPYDGKTIMSVTVSAGIHKFVPAITANGMRFAFELTTNIDKLRCIHFTHKIRFYYSELTKAEVLRALRRSHSNRDQREIVSWWKALCYLLEDYNRVESENFDQELSQLALSFPISKNVQDYIHLILAKQNQLAFITSDKLDGQINAIRENYYSQIYYWPEIRQDIPILPELET